MNDVQPYKYAPRHELIWVPGDPVYEHLLKTNPKKLQRFIKRDMARFNETHAPGWADEWNAKLEWATETVDRIAKKKPDGKLLGLDTITEPLTKRDVKNAYRRAARKMHPDAGGSEEAFKQLHEAYRRVLAATKA